MPRDQRTNLAGIPDVADLVLQRQAELEGLLQVPPQLPRADDGVEAGMELHGRQRGLLALEPHHLRAAEALEAGVVHREVGLVAARDGRAAGDDDPGSQPGHALGHLEDRAATAAGEEEDPLGMPPAQDVLAIAMGPAPEHRDVALAGEEGDLHAIARVLQLLHHRLGHP